MHQYLVKLHSIIHIYKNLSKKKNMNTKYLIETLIEIPDKELLAQLSSEIFKAKQLLIPDIRKFFHMISCLLQGNDKGIKIGAIQLYKNIFDKILVTEVQMSWNQTSNGVLYMLGQQDAEIRKMAKNLIFDLIDQTNNVNMVLQKLYYKGLQNQSILVIINSIKLILKIFQTYKTILQNKTSVNLMKLILEKMISFAQNGRHIELYKNAKDFIDQLFYLKVEKMDDVLDLLNEEILKMLQKMWAENKQKMMRREESQKQQQLKKAMYIKYEHLPLVGGKFFGVYEPFMLKNIFNPEVQAAKYNALKHFREGFERQEIHLQKYLNVIYKVIVKFIHERHYDLILMLKKIVSKPGKKNIINLVILPGLLIPQLNSQQVPYRREVREIMKVLNYDIPKQSLQKYQQELTQNPNMGWLQLHQILCLLEHWIDGNMEESYPPTLNPFLPIICIHSQSGQAKVKQKSLQLLLMILDRYVGYRENLQDIFNEQKIADIEDMVQQRKNRRKGRNAMINQAEDIYRRQYQQERQRFKQYQMSKSRVQK